MQSQNSCASTALSSHHESGLSQQKVKLRLCYGGRFEQVRTSRLLCRAGARLHGFARAGRAPFIDLVMVFTFSLFLKVAWRHPTFCRLLLSCPLQTANNTYKFVGGEYFNESIPYGIRYADFMFKLSEKFRTAVSVKYLAPGEELVPEQLISVQDDADLQVCQPP